MGVIRLLLAFSILIAHSPFTGQFFISGDIAVEIFFIISGFYMAMIINEKYSMKISAFYKNRFFRLYPMYFAVVVAILLIGFIGDKVFHLSLTNYKDILINYNNGNIDLFSMIFIFFSNFSLLFQDLIMFLRLEGGHLVFGPFMQSTPPVYTLLFVPPAWSISLEIFFYLIAPFILKSKKKIIGLLVLSAIFRLITYFLGYTNDPFSYRLIFSELSVFALGSLTYHLSKENINNKIVKIALGMLVALFVFWKNILSMDIIGRYWFFVLIAIALPYIFEYTKNNKWDRRIGDLSYPFYITHYFILELSVIFIRKMSSTFSIDSALSPYLIFVLAIIITLCSSMLLLRFVQKPFDSIRYKILNS